MAINQITQMTYRQAMAELTSIVERLRDSEDVDVDELVSDVARAKELITFCGAKVKRADTAIKAIVSELREDVDTTPVFMSNSGETQNDCGDGPIPF